MGAGAGAGGRVHPAYGYSPQMIPQVAPQHPMMDPTRAQSMMSVPLSPYGAGLMGAMGPSTPEMLPVSMMGYGMQPLQEQHPLAPLPPPDPRYDGRHQADLMREQRGVGGTGSAATAAAMQGDPRLSVGGDPSYYPSAVVAQMGGGGGQVQVRVTQ
ncbi:unnamed protein product [Discosporangium mesarthrocarpum]